MARVPPPPVDPVGKMVEDVEDFAAHEDFEAILVVAVPRDGPVILRWGTKSEGAAIRAVAGAAEVIGELSGWLKMMGGHPGPTVH